MQIHHIASKISTYVLVKCSCRRSGMSIVPSPQEYVPLFSLVKREAVSDIGLCAKKNGVIHTSQIGAIPNMMHIEAHILLGTPKKIAYWYHI